MQYKGNSHSIVSYADRFGISVKKVESIAKKLGLKVIPDGSNEPFNRKLLRELIAGQEPNFLMTKSEAFLYIVNRKLYKQFVSTTKWKVKSLNNGPLYQKSDVDAFIVGFYEAKDNAQPKSKEEEQPMAKEKNSNKADSVKSNTVDERFGFFNDLFKDFNAPSKREILAVCFDLTETLLRKNCDYGNSALTAPTIADVSVVDAVLVRKEDKIRRIATLRRNSAKVADETLIDTLMDDAGYDVLAIIAANRNDQNRLIKDEN